MTTRLAPPTTPDLRAIRLYAPCPGQTLEAIGRASDLVEVRAGVTVQRDRSLRWAYGVIDGTLTVQAGSDVHTVSSGDIVGLRAAVSGHRPSVTLVALTDVTLLVTSHAELLGLLASTGLGLLAARELARDETALTRLP